MRCVCLIAVWSTGKIDFVEPDPEEYQAVQMTRDDNVLLNDVYFTSYNMNHHQPLTPLTPISKIVSVPRTSSNLRTLDDLVDPDIPPPYTL